MPEIPEPGSSPELEILRTEAVAELSEESEAPEAIPFKISFQDYKEKECQVSGMNPANATVALKVFRDIGVNLLNEGSVRSCSKYINDVKHIVNTGDYGRLYRNLAEDIEVWEVKCVKTNHDPKKSYDFRLYYYALGPERTFYVLAVRESHYNTDHS